MGSLYHRIMIRQLQAENEQLKLKNQALDSDVKRLLKEADELAGDLIKTYNKSAQPQAENEKLKEELIEIHREFVAQNCTMRDGKLDSMALSINARTMRFLAERGEIVIEKEFGRRVIGHWSKAPKQKE